MTLSAIAARNLRMHRAASLLVPGIALVLNACAAPPTGPSVMALPGQGKNFAAFQQDDVGADSMPGSRPVARRRARQHRRVRSAALSSAPRSAPPRGPRSERRPARPVQVPRSAPARVCWQAARSAPTMPPQPTAVCSNSTTSVIPSAWSHTATACRHRQPVMPPILIPAYPVPLSVSLFRLLRTGRVRAVSRVWLRWRMGLGQRLGRARSLA